MECRKRSLIIIAFLAALSAPQAYAGTAQASAEPAESAATGPTVRELYTKFEYQIPMRDGVHLYTVVYVPKDRSTTYPFLMVRTPYGVGVHQKDQLHYGVDYYPASLGPSKEFEKSGYIFVQQDVRGRYMSEGKWQEMTPHINPDAEPGQGNESRDMHDTVDWLLKHVPHNNGKVGIWGISYPGFYTSASIIDSHPAIKAASPQAPVTDLYMGDDSYHGGAFMLSANFDFYAAFTEERNPTVLPKKWEEFDYGTGNAYEYFLRDLTLEKITARLSDKQRALLMPTIEHSSYDDFWQKRNIAPHLKNIKAAVLTVGGWFDAEDLQGPFTTYQAIQKNNPGIYNGLVIGPWSHGGWAKADGKLMGNVDFGAKTAEFYRKNILFPFFEHYLKDARIPAMEKNYMFETGTNVWRTYPSWPPQQAQAKTLYFTDKGGLSWQVPAQSASDFDEYVSDPRRPVPYIAYAATGVPREYMVSDQRFASTRPDVLVYKTDPLREDVTIVGAVTPHLFASTSGTDADWVVKLIDVYPDEYPDEDVVERTNDVPPPAVTLAGYQQLVRGGPLRSRFRHGFEHPVPVQPGKVEEIKFDLNDVNHTFRRGHRIMVQIQSTWFPLIDLNPQKFVDIPHAQAADFQKATQRIYHAQNLPSGLEVKVLPASQQQ